MNILSKTFLGTLLSSLVTFSTATLYAAEDDNLSFATTEVAPGLYMLKGVGGFTGGNIALSVGEDGVVMIDDSMPPMLDIMQTAINSVTDKPVDFLINTHVHGDHIGNNDTFGKAGTWIVAHNNLRQHMLDKGVKGEKTMVPAPKTSLPVITFAHSMDFHLNGYNAHIFHVSSAHTDGDAIIHYKDANVIHTGDVLFNGLYPFIDTKNGGSLDGFIKAQKKILTLTDNKTKIIPGHGPLANRNDLKASIKMLEFARDSISDLIKDGKTEEEIVALKPLAEYHDNWSWRFINSEKMTKQIYKILLNNKPG